MNNEVIEATVMPRGGGVMDAPISFTSYLTPRELPHLNKSKTTTPFIQLWQRTFPQSYVKRE